MISVYLLDDHPLVLDGLRHVLSSQPDIAIAGEETDAPRACDALRRLHPNVLVVDLKMSPMSGLDVVRRVTRELPTTRIVVLSMHDEIPYVWEAVRCGAQGYVLKCAGRDELLHAVRTVAAGSRYLSPPLSDGRVDAYAKRVQWSASVDPLETLTRREREVFRQAASGMTNAEIAAAMQIGVRTVETHRASALRKLDLHGPIDVVRFAISKGIVLPP